MKLQRTLPPLRPTNIALALAAILPGAPAHAVEFDTGSDLKITWNNTVKYSVAYRLHDADPRLLAGGYPGYGAADLTGFNLDDGNQNFRNKGVVSNRIDWLTEFDAGTRNAGLRISAAAWYDAAYTGSNDNASSATNASSSFRRSCACVSAAAVRGTRIAAGPLPAVFIW